MLKVVEKRGPDSQHRVTWDRSFSRTSDHVANAIAVARLAMLDLRPEADQPMCNETGDVWIAYNGEVYDWAHSAALLMERGAVFRTRSDTEFVLRAYERWGIDCVSRLRGMFAIVILDLRLQQLWLIRDRMGLKPLLYSHVDGNIAFGSTVRSVVPFLAAHQRSFSPAAIDAFLAHRYIPAPRTIYRNVNRLENGHWIRFDIGSRQIEHKRHWFPGVTRAELLPLLDESIAIRTISDRPVGVFLSSGVDSSIIAQRLAAMGRPEIPAFTASFPGSTMDESGDASKTALALGLSHSVVPMPNRIAADFPTIIADLDEPFADPSAFPTWYLCRRATQSVKTVLTGDGLDELLGGYKRVWKHMRTSWRRSWSIPWLPTIASASPKGWSKWSAEIRMSWLESYSLRFSGFTPGQRVFLQPDHARQAPTYWRMTGASGLSPLATLLETDFENYLPEYILRKADLCSMAHGLEIRAPFLDHHWVEAVNALEPGKRFASPRKSVMERVCPDLKPFGLFDRTKRGFNPPLRAWLEDDLAERFDGLGTRLEGATGGQISAAAVATFSRRFLGSKDSPSEQLLQLLVLDESLRQLRTIE